MRHREYKHRRKVVSHGSASIEGRTIYHLQALTGANACLHVITIVFQVIYLDHEILPTLDNVRAEVLSSSHFDVVIGTDQQAMLMLWRLF